MECQLCNLKYGEHTVTAQGICGYCAESLMSKLRQLEKQVAELSACPDCGCKD